MYFLLSFLLFVTSIAVCLVYSYQMVYAMILGYVLLAAAAMRRGSRLSTVLRASALGVKEALLVIEILLLIGLLTAEWRASGVIAFFVYHGVGLITPKLFILIAFLLTCFISYALGTSIGVAGTAGVILMAIARSGGVNELLAAGAILSGVYFGDRCSPTASSANLIAALTKTDLYGNVSRMFRTALIPTVVCIAAYCFLSFNNPLYISNAGYLAEIKEGLCDQLVGAAAGRRDVLLPAYEDQGQIRADRKLGCGLPHRLRRSGRERRGAASYGGLRLLSAGCGHGGYLERRRPGVDGRHHHDTRDIQHLCEDTLRLRPPASAERDRGGDDAADRQIMHRDTVEPLRLGNILQPDNLLHHGGHPPEKTVHEARPA